MRFGPRVPIGLLGVFVLSAVGCSGSSPAQPSGEIPVAVAAGAGGSAATVARGALRFGGVRRSVPACTGSGTGSFVGANNSNVAAGDYSGVVSGTDNDACDPYSGILAGDGDTINSAGVDAYEFIGAGFFNTISGGNDNFIGAGYVNVISGGNDAFIGAGSSNSVSALDGAVTGGYKNTVSGQYASILGGSSNTASGTESTVAGGGNNIAGCYASFAAGYHADANQGGSFVWSDNSSSAATKPTAANEFVARSAGGVKFFSNSAMTTGVSLAAGGGSWASVSDRAVKTHVESIDDGQILDRVAAMPITEWSYISERGVRHVGPMAQDFYAAFNIGEDNKHITSIDEDGVALAAIKALNHKLALTNGRLAQKDAALHVLHRQMNDFKSQVRQQVNELRKEVAALHARG